MNAADLDISGLRIRYLRAGEGRAVVFLHGFFCDSRVWRPQFEAFADRFTVIAWDAPGCGGSSTPPENFRMHDYADCLATFIQALALERPCVVGLSFGGALAVELHRRHPSLPGALVLADAYAGWAGSLPRETVEQRLRQSLSDLKLPPEQVVARWLPGFLTDSASAPLVDDVAAMISEFRPDGMRVMIRSLAEADLSDGLGQIEVPVLLLWGDRDVRSPLTIARQMNAAIHGSKLVVLQGAGHLSNVEAAPAFNSRLRAFLDSLQG